MVFSCSSSSNNAIYWIQKVCPFSRCLPCLMVSSPGSIWFLPWWSGMMMMFWKSLKMLLFPQSLGRMLVQLLTVVFYGTSIVGFWHTYDYLFIVFCSLNVSLPEWFLNLAETKLEVLTVYCMLSFQLYFWKLNCEKNSSFITLPRHGLHEEE